MHCSSQVVNSTAAFAGNCNVRNGYVVHHVKILYWLSRLHLGVSVCSKKKEAAALTNNGSGAAELLDNLEDILVCTEI